jgi:hypothetical protein
MANCQPGLHMSAKNIRNGIEIHDVGGRRLYVKSTTGFVLHNDDLTPEELVAIATDIAGHNLEKESQPGAAWSLETPVSNKSRLRRSEQSGPKA